jgi:hypothetical protein
MNSALSKRPQNLLEALRAMMENGLPLRTTTKGWPLTVGSVLHRPYGQGSPSVGDSYFARASWQRAGVIFI